MSEFKKYLITVFIVGIIVCVLTCLIVYIPMVFAWGMLCIGFAGLVWGIKHLIFD